MLAFLAMLWGSSSATSSSQSCSTIFYMVLLLYQNNETSSPGLLGCHTFSGDYPVLLTFYSGYPKHLPNLFNTSWLFRIARGIWANQKRRYILKESNDNDASVLSKSLLRTSRKVHSLPFFLFFVINNYLQVKLTLQPIKLWAEFNKYVSIYVEASNHQATW